MNYKSLNETSTDAAPVSIRRRRFPLKLAVSAVVGVVLISHTSKAVKDRIDAREAGTILPAQIRAARVFSIVAELPGSVLSISAAAGQSIRPGQELATLEAPELSLALEKAEARLARAEERRAALATGNPSVRILAEQSRAAEAVSKTACARANDFNTGDLERRNYDDALARTKKVETLVADRLATSAELERWRREEEEAVRALAAWREQRSRLQQECESSLAQVRVAKLQRDLAQHSELESAQTEYADALAQLNTLSQQTKSLHVIAQRPGTVLSAPVAAGDRVAAGAVLFQMGDLSELSVEVPVGGKIARQVREGDKVLVRLPMDPPRQVKAAVSAVLLAPGQDTQSYVVRVLIPNPDPRVILAGLEGVVVFRHSPNVE
jgi:multidrug resistance efflux pump